MAVKPSTIDNHYWKLCCQRATINLTMPGCAGMWLQFNLMLDITCDTNIVLT